MILDSIKIPLTKEEITISKIDNVDFKGNMGNFCKYLKTKGYSIEEYMKLYYADFLPKCLESGKVSNWKKQGTYGEYYPLCKEYVGLSRKVKQSINTISRIQDSEPEYITEYLDYEYWIRQGNSLSEAFKYISYFLKGDCSYYRRLSDNYYDSTWTENAKNSYKNSILNLKADYLHGKFTKKGFLQRGQNHILEVESKNYYKNRICSFRDPILQKRLSDRRQEKYNTIDLKRSLSCRNIAFWLKRGYNLYESRLKIKDIQTTNSIKSIAKRHKCSEEDAKHIQFEIYNLRRNTFLRKNQKELDLINKKKDSGSLEYCLRKTNFDISAANKLYADLLTKRIVPIGKASKESLRYFIPLYRFLRSSGIKRTDIYLGISGSQEYFIFDQETKKFRLYDFVILSKKLILEYDGKYWHSNKEYDDEKDNIAIKKGFSILRIPSEIPDTEKFTLINSFLHEKIQITNPDWGTI
jgi:hypothetical protein